MITGTATAVIARKKSRPDSSGGQLIIKSIKWLENYEAWVLATCGQSYRNESLYGMSSQSVHDICLDKKWSELYEKFTKIQIKNNVM